ncbi:MAG TPA: hypothetical protein VFC47_08095 [Caulobacteraceae bacterium]|nr:hypothetical protein [Caulobacteraceae bacterium]
MRASRRLLIIAAACVLAGCNGVMTQAPLFTRADEAGGPGLRSGLWRLTSDPKCRFNEEIPYAGWPACSAGAIVTAGKATFYDGRGGAMALQHQEFVFVAGEPRIVQARVVQSRDVTSPSPPFIYVGARATKLDDEGRIVAIAYWPIQCGPPPPSVNEGGKPGGGVTLHPFPGLIVVPGNLYCTTGSPQALRAAAASSEAISPKLLARWLRDSDSR